MKKFLSILFLFVFLYNVIGYYAMFGILQGINKAGIARSIADNSRDKNIEIIEINKEHLPDLEYRGKDEIKYKGKLYDIVRSEVSNDFIRFYCINDKNEEHLFAKLLEHIIDDIGSIPEKGSKSPKKMLEKDYFSNFFAIKIPVESEHFAYLPITIILKSIIQEVSPPPPKQIIA